MSSNGNSSMITINLDGKEVDVPAGINIIEAASIHGTEVPHYCYHPQLSVAGNCRMCLVEMGTPMRDRGTGEAILDQDGVQKIGWIPKPIIGCGTNVSPGMHIKTNSSMVKGSQEGIMEFLLVNHPLDCPICDQAGECRLQEFATDYGRGYSRYVERKNVKPKRTKLGPRVTLDDERCILCSRCIRFCQEVVDDDVLGFVDRGSFSTLTCFPGKELSNNYSLNTVDLCPVGALTSTDFRFKMRVWFLKESPSICTESSAGCNTLVSSREGEIHRITPRRNDAVNDSWMTDSGRELYKQVKSEDRIVTPHVSSEPSKLADAISSASELLKDQKLAIVGSCRSTVEEQYLLTKLARNTKAKKFLRGHFGEDDGILLSSDRTPNLRGALATGFSVRYPTDQLSDLSQALSKSQFETLLVIGDDLLESGISQDDLKGVKVVFLGTHKNQTSALADIVIPTLTAFEKTGSFINRTFHLQSFKQAVPGPAGLLPDLNILSSLINSLSVDGDQSADLAQIWKQLSKSATSIFHKLSFSSIPSDGLQLNGEKWSELDFVEKKALHFSPIKQLQEA
ncbi:MAG: 2Fe-2S iron-sulfur cluster-binding protein [Opitutales bacterium]|nr:2Fe-2S iron-sulfur cluster-binding protein [Opitutales bacterium]